MARRSAGASRYTAGARYGCRVAAFIAATAIVGAQSRPLVDPAGRAIYQRLLTRIEQIGIFDHHAHPGFADDAEVDPAPVPPSALLYRLRPDNLDGRPPLARSTGRRPGAATARRGTACSTGSASRRRSRTGSR
jgi:hypothetical protein